MLRVAPARVVAAPAPAMPAPMVPVAAPPPVVIAEPAEAPYTLDSGDRLRVVVFGQEGLTNSYAVDPSGRITMPLIGAVPARGLTTARATAAQSPAGCVRASSASRTSRSRSRPIGRSSSSARSRLPANTPMCPT